MIFVRILIPYILGILLFYPFGQVTFRIGSGILTGLLYLFVLILNRFYLSFQVYRFKYGTGLLFIFLFFSLGTWKGIIHKEITDEKHFSHHKSKWLKGSISGEVAHKNDISRFIVNISEAIDKTKAIAVKGSLLVTLKTGSFANICHGDEIILVNKVMPIKAPQNPGEFDYQAHMAAKNIRHQVFIGQDEWIKTGFNTTNFISKFAGTLRDDQIKTYRKLIKDDEAFAIASTLILGYRADLNQDTFAAYSKTGTIHALSVSGMHVGLVYMVLNLLFRFLDKGRLQKVFKIFVICALIWFYALLTGFSPSVLRSAIMISVYIIAKTFHQQADSYNILAFTAFGLLIYSPFLVWDVGFQLSFLAVWGLIYLQPKIYHWFFFKQKWIDKLWSMMALSIAAQLTTLPLSIYYFHQFPVYFIISNLFIALPVMLLMYMGIMIFFGLHFLAPVFEHIIIWMNEGLKWIAKLPLATLEKIWISPLQMLLLSLGLFLLLYALSTFQKKILFLSLLCFLTFRLMECSKHFQIKTQKEIIFFSLQKGYATAFITGNKAFLVSDLNTGEKSFQFSIKPALDQRQVTVCHILSWDAEMQDDAFIKRHHQIRFHQFRLLLLDTFFNRRKIVNTPHFEIVLVHHHPTPALRHIQSSIHFDHLIFDSAKPSERQNFTDNIYASGYFLKKNKAYLINLNK